MLNLTIKKVRKNMFVGVSLLAGWMYLGRPLNEQNLYLPHDPFLGDYAAVLIK